MSNLNDRINGVKVAMTRAPMTTPAFVNVRVIKESDSEADYIEEDVVYISPLASTPDGGDNDGDNRSFVLSTDSDDLALPTLSIEEIQQNLIDRTGSDQLNPGKSYWGDHYNVASAGKIANKRSSVDNFSLDVGDDLFSEVERKVSLPTMLEGSTKCFTEAVGWIHMIFLSTDIYCSIVWGCEHIFRREFNWEPEEFTSDRSIVLVASENYEVPLGGLDWGAYTVFYKTLIPVISEYKSLKDFGAAHLEKFREDLEQAGMNSSKYKTVFDSAVKAAECRALSTGKTELNPEKMDINLFIECSTETLKLISKGQLDLDKVPHNNLILGFLYFLNDHQHLIDELLDSSISLRQLYNYATTIYPAIIGEVPVVDLSYFDFE